MPLPVALALVLAFAIGISLPTELRVPVFGGLANLKPWMVVLAVMAAYELFIFRYRRSDFVDPVALLLVMMAVVILARSVWRYALGGPETPFRVLSDWTGSPSWAGATKTRGVLSGLLLLSYTMIVIALRGIFQGGQIRLGVRSAIEAFVVATTIYAGIFLTLLVYSVVIHKGDASAWLVLVRGIDIGPLRAHHAVLLIGPLEGVVYGVAAILAIGSASNHRGRQRSLFIVATAILGVSTILVFSRAAWIGTIVGGILLGVTMYRSRLSWRATIVAISSVVGFMVMIALVAIVFTLTVHGDALSRLLSLGSTAGARLDEYRQMLGASAQSPLVGHGAEAYRPITSGLPAEDFIIEVAYSGGILALAPLVAAHIWLALLYVRARNISGEPLWLLAALAAHGVGALLTTAAWAPSYWLVFGLALVAIRNPHLWQSTDKRDLSI